MSSRFAPLTGAALLAAVLMMPATAAADSYHQNLVRRGQHNRRQLEARVWTSRGDDAVYRNGQRVHIKFETSDDAYVVVYNIDARGGVHVLYPIEPGDDGHVRGRRAYHLPPPGADIDFVVDGPEGVEYLAIVASRYPIRDPYTGALAHYDDPDWRGYLNDPEWETDLSAGWDERRPKWLEDADDYAEDWDMDRSIAWADEADDERWVPHGWRIAGDPFVAMRRINHWLVPEYRERHVAQDYATLYVERRHRYPRYACNDCHGFDHHHDPYYDSCSVFSIRINTGWRYYPWRVRYAPRYRPLFVYERHRRVPRRYARVKRYWPSHERSRLHSHFRRHVAPPRLPAHKTPHRVEPKKSKRGYDWKGDSRRRYRRRLDATDRKRSWTDRKRKDDAGRRRPARTEERQRRSDPTRAAPPPAVKRRSNGKEHPGTKGSGREGGKKQKGKGPVKKKRRSG